MDQHITKKFKNYGVDSLVLLLNNEPKITEEARAMLCALYSRSPDSIINHLDVVAKKGADKFMSSYYVGYGHQSIGDNANGTIFIENISMLAAKALQDNPLYSGQEVSTRYVDYTTQAFLNPLGTKIGKEIQEGWRAFYLAHLEPTIVFLKTQFPAKPEENVKLWEKAIKARAFDILRGFLPAGAVTSVAYHMNLRQIADHMRTLRHHPLPEVRDICTEITHTVTQGFPNSFGHKVYEKTEAYLEDAFKDYYYFNPHCSVEPVVVHDGLDQNFLNMYTHKLQSRPPKTELPNYLNVAGTISFEFQLDFASFRDLQRHRSLYQTMPLLTSKLGFQSWYLTSLPSEFQATAKELLDSQIQKIEALDISPEEKQYYLPMGLKVSQRVTGALSKLLYTMELRASKTVHPTLSRVAYKIGTILKDRFSHLDLAVHLDDDYDNFDIKRGSQDITKKE